jgi:hypothetical protein
VKTKDGIHWKLGEEAIFDHLAGSCATLLGGLENENDRPVEIAVFGKVLRRAEKHGRMPIVPTRVHLSGVLGAVSEVVEFLDRKRIHVRAKADGPLARTTLEYPDHTGLAQPAMNFDTPVLESLRYELRSQVFFVTQFRMSVNISSKRLNFVSRGKEFRNEFHNLFDLLVKTVNKKPDVPIRSFYAHVQRNDLCHRRVANVIKLQA